MRVLGVPIISITLIVGSGFLSTAAAQEPCGWETAGPGDPEALELVQPWVDPVAFEDPAGDFLLDHPFYEKNFDAPGVFDEAEIPETLDIAGVDLIPEEETFTIGIRMGPAREPELGALLEPGRRTANVGIYFDVDRNGVSDYLAITSDQGAVILPDSLDEVIAEAGLDVTDTSVAFTVARDLVGDRFDWIAFTTFAPIEGAYFRTPLDFMFFAPPIDIYTPQDLPVNIGFSTGYTGTGVQCQVTDSYYDSCPAKGNVSLVSVPGTTYQGVLIYRVQCNGRGYGFWCISQSFFGKEALDPGQLGWIARCPFPCGWNTEDRWDRDADGLVDEILHTIADRDCVDQHGVVTHHDHDNDTLLDVMEHTYTYAGNSLASCNVERDYQTLSVVHDPRCLPARSPYGNPSSVPGSVN